MSEIIFRPLFILFRFIFQTVFGNLSYLDVIKDVDFHESMIKYIVIADSFGTRSGTVHNGLLVLHQDTEITAKRHLALATPLYILVFDNHCNKLHS